ncbi:phospho-acceptor domain-containing protein [Thermosporothrix hazakensis]|uniref:histidine kinase n=2 Tax=Thermosporothrix hazakensis TaxID=644383 RepID=A0A326U5B0_THEHA|nr:HAMP domain-containing sensor histidine kinase [Thermosporothrix hazakensis]PZW26634.1 phospho-acceptor domain-containing protein [Thermosporothrix hazakensis]
MIICKWLTGPWPRYFLKSPLLVRLSLCIFSFLICAILHMLVIPQINSGYIISIPMFLASWTFEKRGACTVFFGHMLLSCLYAIFWLHYWPATYLTSFIGSTLLLSIEGCLMVSLRYILNESEAARQTTNQAIQQVKAAYEQQRQLNQLKNQFILNVNHELRTPLAAAYGYLELLLHLLEENGTLEKDAHSVYIKNALNYCEELTRLVNNVLDSMAIGNDNGQLQVETLNLLKSVEEVIQHFNTLGERQQSIQLEISRHLFVHANAQCLRHVLYNLLSNAFKYAPPQSQVRVSAHVEQGTGNVCICVKDAGPGIPPEEIPLLFGQFVRLQRDLGGPVRGSGLGLYISKHLVEVMGGRIWVESRGIPGEGSSFCFTLPGIGQQRYSEKSSSYSETAR